MTRTSLAAAEATNVPISGWPGFFATDFAVGLLGCISIARDGTPLKLKSTSWVCSPVRHVSTLSSGQDVHM